MSASLSVADTAWIDADFQTVMRVLVEEGRDLCRWQSRQVVSALLEQRFDALEMAAILTALARKGETADEIAGAVDAIQARHPPCDLGTTQALNIGGTGGDRAGTFNISTTASFVVAAAGVPVVKHGNRSVTSACGSSDMMAALGVPIQRRSDVLQMRADLQAANFAFVATSAYYGFPALLTEVRRRMGIRSLFNLAGPLVHPAGVRFQLLGVARACLMGPVVNAMVRLGGMRAFVVHGVDGLDEVSCVGDTLVSSVRDGVVKTFRVRPEDFDVQPCLLQQLRGGDPQRNARICQDVLLGQPGPYREATVVAASAALVLAGRFDVFRDAAAAARQAIDSGRAHQILTTFKEARYEDTREDMRHHPS